MVVSWLLNAMSKEIYESFMTSRNARQIWLDLDARFSQSSGAQRCSIERQICSISQGADSIAGLLTRIKKIWDEQDSLRAFPPCECGLSLAVHQYEQDQRLFPFLNAVDDSYASVRSGILMNSPLPNINHEYFLLTQEETQRSLKISKMPIDSSANAVSVRNSKDSSQSSSSSKDSDSVNQSRHNGNKQRHVCSHCNRTGHLIDRCYKLHGYPLGSSSAKTKGSANSARTNSPESSSTQSAIPGLSVDQYHQLINLLQKSSPTTSSPPSFGNFAGPFSEEPSGAW